MTGQYEENATRSNPDNPVEDSSKTLSFPVNAKLLSIASLVILLVVAMMISWFNNGWYDNDQWFILANGRYIVNHGIPYENPFSMWGGKTVIENWGWSVLCWIAWNHLGRQTGLTILSMIVLAISILVCWAIINRLCSDYTTILVGTALYAFTSIISFSIRPWMISSLFMLVSIYLIVRWMQDGKVHWLALLPLITLVAFNMHMAMAWMTILLPGCWMLSMVIIRPHRLKTFCESAITVACQLAVTLINPYGLDGVLFLARSYGVTKYDQTIETSPLLTVLSNKQLYDAIKTYFLAGLIAVLFLLYSVIVAIMNRKNLDKTLFLGTVFMMIGLFIASLTAVRNINLFLITIPIATALSVTGDNNLNVTGNNGARSNSKYTSLLLRQSITNLIVIAFMAIASVASLTDVFLPPSIIEKAFTTNSNSGTASEAVKSIVPYGSKIITDGFLGSKLTFDGYKTSFDMRPELLTPPITGLHENYLKEQINAYSDTECANKLIDKYKGESKWWLVRTENYYPSNRLKDALDNRPDTHLVKHSDEYKWYLYEIR